MAIDFAGRRAEIAAGCEKSQKTRGSGWHPGDIGAEAREKAGQPALTDRPIVLQDNDRIAIVNPDLAVIRKSVQQFLAKLDAAKKKAAERGWEEPDLLSFGVKYQRNVVRACQRFLEIQPEPVLLTTLDWNQINQAIATVGIHVVSATAEIQSYD